MDLTSPSVLAVKTLNYWRRKHIPTYIGLRCLFNSISNIDDRHRFYDFIKRKSYTRNIVRAHKYTEFKKISEDGIIKYKHFYALSPTTAIFEAWAINILHSSNLYLSKPYIYSYRMPNIKHSGHLYEFFLNGYHERNQNIFDILKSDRNLFASIFDIKQFYPSINRENVLSTLIDKIKKCSLESSIYNSLIKIIEQVITLPNNGIPIGPAISVIFGNEALEKIDNELFKIFQERYFRYVDDIIVICSKNEVTKIKKLVNDTLSKYGFEPNLSKYDYVNYVTWKDNLQFSDGLVQDVDRLFDKIRLLLIKNPNVYDLLKEEVIKNNLTLPIDRLKAETIYPRYLLFLRNILKKQIGIFSRHSQIDYSIKTIIDSAKNIRERFVNYLLVLKKKDIPQQPIEKKWYVQKCQYFLNRLLYLFDFNNYSQIRSLIPNKELFYELYVLIDSINKNKISNLLKIPGKAPSAFGALKHEYKSKKIKINCSELENSEIINETLSTLLAYGIIDLSWDLPNSIERYKLPFILSKDIFEKRIFDDLSYYDELQTLRINSKSEQLSDLLFTRFSKDDYTDFEAFSIGSLSYGYY